jgi:hypothetical protein
MTYRVTEYDETDQGRPSFLVESDSSDPLEPALFVVAEPAHVWATFRTDGSRYESVGRNNAIRAARTRLRELEASGHYR